MLNVLQVKRTEQSALPRAANASAARSLLTEVSSAAPIDAKQTAQSTNKAASGGKAGTPRLKETRRLSQQCYQLASVADPPESQLTASGSWSISSLLEERLGGLEDLTGVAVLDRWVGLHDGRCGCVIVWQFYGRIVRAKLR